MKSHNKFLASAIAVAIGTLASSAFAGNMSTTTRYLATEVFGPTQAATVALTPTAVSYSISSAGGSFSASTPAAARASDGGQLSVSPMRAWQSSWRWRDASRRAPRRA